MAVQAWSCRMLQGHSGAAVCRQQSLKSAHSREPPGSLCLLRHFPVGQPQASPSSALALSLVGDSSASAAAPGSLCLHREQTFLAPWCLWVVCPLQTSPPEKGGSDPRSCSSADFCWAVGYTAGQDARRAPPAAAYSPIPHTSLRAAPAPELSQVVILQRFPLPLVGPALSTG